MTDLNKKEKLSGILCYLAYAAVLTFQRHDVIALSFFAFTAVVVLLADKLIKCDAIHSKTLAAFFVTAVGFQSTFEIFYASHIDIKQTLSAAAVAIFYACLFMLTDKAKLPWCLVAVPVLCVLNVRIAIGYCVLVLCLSLITIGNKADKIAIAGAAVGAAGLVACIILALTADGYFLESSSYLLSRFKNPLFLIIIAAYLLARLIKVRAYDNRRIIVCAVLLIAATVFATLTLGWSAFSLLCLCMPLFCGILCLADSRIITAIKADFNNHKFIFLAIIVCALQ